ncbi:Ataxin-3 [Chelonia mydas]|uniref:Ataxin-3 n=1 Tax=Chelonia mydas TaxID=8469 RepID=M7C5X6_CHEMY|nr:Ataxin-3 [Chelonia mydas]
MEALGVGPAVTGSAEPCSAAWELQAMPVGASHPKPRAVPLHTRRTKIERQCPSRLLTYALVPDPGVGQAGAALQDPSVEGIQKQGYSIFVVKGDLPDCEADQLLQMIQVQQMQRPKLIGEESAQSRDERVQKTDLEQALDMNHPFDGTGMLDEDEENFQRALALSRQEIDMEDEEADLRRAIQLSMQGGHRSEFSDCVSQNIPHSSGTSQSESLSSEELRRRRQTYFEKQQQQSQHQGQTPDIHDKPTTSSNALGTDPGGDMSEDDMLQAAMNMSLETVRNCLNTEEKK